MKAFMWVCLYSMYPLGKMKTFNVYNQVLIIKYIPVKQMSLTDEEVGIGVPVDGMKRPSLKCIRPLSFSSFLRHTET